MKARKPARQAAVEAAHRFQGRFRARLESSLSEGAMRIEEIFQDGLFRFLTASRYDHSARPDRILGDMAQEVFAESLQAGLERFLAPVLDLPQQQEMPALGSQPSGGSEGGYGGEARRPGMAGSLLAALAAFDGGALCWGYDPGMSAGAGAPGGDGSTGAWERLQDSAATGITATDLRNFYKYGGNVFQTLDQAGNAGSDLGIAGVSAGAAESAGGGSASSAGAAQYAQAGLGLVGIYQQGAQGGALTGALGGALSGEEMGVALGGAGAAIGAGVGGLVGLLGGLFGHHSQPQPQINQQLNPAIFHSPADFDYYAYLYRATGGKLTAQQQADYNAAFPGFQTNAPFVPAASLNRAVTLHTTTVVNIDGAQVAQQTTTRQVLASELDSASQGGTHDYRLPV